MNGEGDQIPAWKETYMRKGWLCGLASGRDGQTQTSNSWELQGQDGRLERVEKFVDYRLKNEVKGGLKARERSCGGRWSPSFKGREGQPWRRH